MELNHEILGHMIGFEKPKSKVIMTFDSKVCICILAQYQAVVFHAHCICTEKNCFMISECLCKLTNIFFFRTNILSNVDDFGM